MQNGKRMWQTVCVKFDTPWLNQQPAAQYGVDNMLL